MIRINLLPDIKQQYLKSQKAKRLFIIGALMVSAVFATITLLVGLWVGGQKLHLDRLQGDIDQAAQQLEEQTELPKIVTVQNQLNALPGLHTSRMAMQRLPDYLAKVVPNNIVLSNLILSTAVENPTLEIRGQTVDAKTVNIFADTLKNATYTYGPDNTQIKPFTNVQVSSIAITNDGGVTGGDTSFVITLVYDLAIFDNTYDEFQMTIPTITSSPSVTERPDDLFAEPAENEGGDQ